MSDVTRAEGLPRMKRVGHKGADLVAPGNTIASFRAALDAGVDMIEFDVLRMADGRLVLAHDFDDARERFGELVTLDEGLDHFAGEAYAGVELDVDLKVPGYEREVAEAIEARGLSDRALVSTMYGVSLRRLGDAAPGLRRGWSVPRVRRDYTKSLLAPGAYLLLLFVRRRLPRKAAWLLCEGGCEALMAHWLLVTPELVGAVHDAGGQVYVWTVDDPKRIEHLEAIGVDGVITNDPRLFGALPA